MMRVSEFMQWWRQAFANYFFQSVITKPGQGASTEDVVLMSSEDGTPTQALTRLEQFGDVVIPPSKKTQCISLVSGAAGVTMSLCDPGTRPNDGKPGDRGLYSNQAGTRIHLYGTESAEPGLITVTNASGASVQIKADGSILVNSASAKDIVFNGGNQEVTRKGDGVWGSDLRVEVTSDGGMPPKDIITFFIVSLDPDDPNYLNPVQLFKFKVANGDALAPPMMVPIQLRLRGVTVEGAARVKA